MALAHGLADARRARDLGAPSYLAIGAILTLTLVRGGFGLQARYQGGATPAFVHLIDGVPVRTVRDPAPGTRS